MLSICFFNFKLDHEIINASEGKLICHIARIKKCSALQLPPLPDTQAAKTSDEKRCGNGLKLFLSHFVIL